VFQHDLATRIVVRAALMVAVVGTVASLRYHAAVIHDLSVGGLVALVLIAFRVTWSVARFCRSPRAAKGNYPRMILASWRWRWLARNLGIAYRDPHAEGRVIHRAAIGPTIGTHVRVEHPQARIQYPHAVFRADEFGIIARVKTTPRAGRADFEKHAPYIADAWECWRVQVAQPKPGRVILRGIRRDPLAEPFGIHVVPRGVYDRTEYSPVAYLGRDEWASHRDLNLYGVTGIAVGGLPDYGKTSLLRSLAMQEYPTPAVQHVVIDGKGGGDYLGQQSRIWLLVGNDLQLAADTLARLEAFMNQRLAVAGRIPGPVNRWEVGPTEDYPLVVITIDECHSFFDLEAVKGDKERERLVRQCRSSAANIIRMGRSVLFRLQLVTQKQTADAIPTAIRDICQFATSFAAKTESGAEAVLGEQIKRYPSYSPVLLQEKPTFVGVCTAALPTGADPFVRIRVPHVTDEQAAYVAESTAANLRDPEALLEAFLGPRRPYAVPDLPGDNGIPA
jgi:DNA segregation ATPase FtsK/SpoIIIE, S-DNA-T family